MNWDYFNRLDINKTSISNNIDIYNKTVDETAELNSKIKQI